MLPVLTILPHRITLIVTLIPLLAIPQCPFQTQVFIHSGTSIPHSSAPCAVLPPALLPAAAWQVVSDLPRILLANSTYHGNPVQLSGMMCSSSATKWLHTCSSIPKSTVALKPRSCTMTKWVIGKAYHLLRLMARMRPVNHSLVRIPTGKSTEGRILALYISVTHAPTVN